MTHPALLKMLEKYDLTNSNSSYDALKRDTTRNSTPWTL